MAQRLRVAHFNTYTMGGAAIAARKIHAGLQVAGVDSTFFYRVGAPADGSFRAYSAGRFPSPEDTPAAAILSRIQSRLSDRVNAAFVEPGREFSHSVQPICTTPPAKALDADVVHLHWVADWFNVGAFLAHFRRGTPVVWTLHDMHPLTGGCHYSGDCRRYTQGCAACPMLKQPGGLDLAAREYRSKRAAVGSEPVHIVADSTWLEGEARKSAQLSQARSFQTIHYGVDTDTLMPLDRRACRIELGLDPSAFVVGLGAANIQDPRKGMNGLAQALTLMADGNTQVIGFGSGKLPADFFPCPAKLMGAVHDLGTLAKVYSSMDCFVMPSLQEAFGQTAQEAMACGVPVVAYAAGGLPDIVVPDITGLLARVGDAADLASQLNRMRLDPEARVRMGTQARSMMETRFTLKHQADAYVKLYQSALSP